MRILNRYIVGSFFATFAATVAVFTFVLSLGGLFKLTELLTRGVSWRPVLGIFLCSMPQAVSFAIPISALAGALLVFGRLSADSEITAMKASGVSLWRIMSWFAPMAALLVGACLYVNNELAPKSHFARRSAVADLGMHAPVELLEEGRFIQDFDGLTVYIGRKRGDELADIRIMDLREEGKKREILAKKGTIRASTNATEILIDLQEVSIDPFSFDRPGVGTCSRWPLRIDNTLRGRTYTKRNKDRTFRELFDGLWGPDRGNPGTSAEHRDRLRMAMSVELHKRLALSASCFSFLLLGIPLGIRSHRRESSIGVGISLLIVFVFYLFIVVAETMAKHPAWHPDIFTWVPVFLCVALGGVLIRRMN